MADETPTRWGIFLGGIGGVVALATGVVGYISQNAALGSKVDTLMHDEAQTARSVQTLEDRVDADDVKLAVAEQQMADLKGEKK